MSGPAFRELIRKFVGFYAERLFNPPAQRYGQSQWCRMGWTIAQAS